MWVIRSERKPKRVRPGRKEGWYWANEFGWTSKDQADRFTEEEKETFLLPRGGVWEELQ
jgi:hypothetical protein